MLFLVLPTAIVGLIDRFLPLGGFKVLVEGALKLALFVGYLFLCTRSERRDPPGV